MKDLNNVIKADPSIERLATVTKRLFLFSLWYHPSHFGMHVDDMATAFSRAGYDVTIVTVNRAAFDNSYFDAFRHMFDVTTTKWQRIFRLNVESLVERGSLNPIVKIVRDQVFDACMQEIRLSNCHLIHFFEFFLADFNAEIVSTSITSSLIYAGNFVTRILADNHGELTEMITIEKIVFGMLAPYSLDCSDGSYRLRGVDCILSETRELPEMLRATKLRTPAHWISRPISCESVLKAPPYDIHRGFGIPENAKVLLYAGRPSKNARVLPKVLGLVRRDYAKAEPVILLLIGARDDDIVDWDQLCEQRAHIRAVPFVGRDMLFGIMKTVDVFTYPGLLDGYPKVVSEASLAGAPIVAFSSVTSGLNEMVENERSALVINVASPDRSTDLEVEHFAAAIHRILTDSELRDRLTQRAFDAAMEMDTKQVVARIERQWEQYRRS